MIIYDIYMIMIINFSIYSTYCKHLYTITKIARKYIISYLFPSEATALHHDIFINTTGY